MLRPTFITEVLLIVTAAAAADTRPHIIFILVDDLGWNDVSFHGMTQISTPNIDALASDGVILNNYYVCPMCTPSRAALLSGLYPSHTGLQNYVIPDNGPWGLPLDLTLLPEKLNELGYISRIVGKWHLGFHKKKYTPTYRGFHSHYGFWTGDINFFNHVSYTKRNRSDYINIPESLSQQTSISLEGIDFRDGLRAIKEARRYLTDDLTESALRIIKRHNQSQPLFLLLAHHAVHCGSGDTKKRAPTNYTDEFSYIKDKERRQFAGVLRALDNSIGLVLQALYKTGMLEKSIIVFSTDNGADAISQTRNAGSNWPFRGQKFTSFEGGVRGVAFVWKRSFRNKGRIWEGMMHIADWYPTLYEAAGGNVGDLVSLDGLSVWQAISTNGSSPRKEMLLSLDPIWNMSAIRMGNYKLMYGNYPNDDLNDWYGTTGRDENVISLDPQVSIVSQTLDNLYGRLENDSGKRHLKIEYDCAERSKTEWTTPCYVQEEVCLFDIKKDPCEYDNIASEKPKIVKKLLRRLAEYQKTAVPPLNKPRDYLSNPAFHDGMWSPWLDDTSDSQKNI